MARGDQPRATHFVLAAQVLDEVLEARRPADAIVAGVLRSRRAGRRDRATVSSLVYGVLRSYFPLRTRLGPDASMIDLCAALALERGDPLPPLREVDADALRQRLQFEVDLDEASRHNLPQWIWARLKDQFGETDGAALAAALNVEADVELRVNTMLVTRDKALEQLAAEGIDASPLDGMAAGIRLSKRVPLHGLQCFQDGWIEPQDAGSQALVQAFAPRPGEQVVDFCAGAGGKTLAIGALMQDQGRLLAMDSNESRLSRLQPRLQRSGLSIVESRVMAASEPPPDDLRDTFDAVLVDAPCSGMGTLRRHPELRLHSDGLDRFGQLQGGILRKAATLVRPGGRLMYATCSLFREENEEVVESFLREASDFSAGGSLRLLPHIDGTDGYYAATLIRTSY